MTQTMSPQTEPTELNLEKPPRTPPRLAIFTRHSLLDGRPSFYNSPPGSGMTHPFLGSAPFNVGDNFVSMAIARALNVEEFLVLTHGAPEAVFDYVNEMCEALIVVSQNSLHPGFFGKFLPRSFLEKRIKIPMIFVSLGVQFELDETPHLTQDDVTSLKIIHERCASSQVRGQISADLLAQHGIHNTRVLGCPSILWSLEPKIKMKTPSMDRVGWTLTEMGGDRGPLQDAQLQFMDGVASQADTFVPIAQGGEYVLQEYLTVRDGLSLGKRIDTLLELAADGRMMERPRTNYYGIESQPELMRCRLERPSLSQLRDNVKWYYRNCSLQVILSLIEDSFFSTEVASYMYNARNLSLMTGTRLHGNIMGLSQGVPTYYAYHDLRVKEMADLFDVPRCDIRENPDSIDLNAHDWTSFEKRYAELYKGFMSFFKENGLSHAL